MYNLIFGPALFYDLPEYLQIVASHSFWQSVSLGHFPIHPVFMAILWPLIKIFPVNVIAMLFGAASIFVISKISKKAAVIYAFFPAIWIINTNLLVESILLFFYILATYFYIRKKKILFFLSVFLMTAVHLQGILWLPAVFLTPLILKKKVNSVKFIKLAIYAIILSLAAYLLLYKVSGRDFVGSTEQLSTYFSSGILRMLRNSWLSFATAFGSLTLFVLGFFIFKKAKTTNEKIAWIIFVVFVTIIAANWQGDFMARRIAFAGVILSLGLSQYLKKWWWIFAIYLLPIVIANVILYAKGSPFTGFEIPKGQMFLQSHYYKPFTNYDGIILWIGNDDLGQIDKYLAGGKRVFMTKESVTAPYLLIVGNNYHITSVGKVGDSESRILFKKYIVEPYGKNLELKSLKGGVVSDKAGEIVVSYDQSFWGRLERRRIDYGDIGMWIWALITNHRDPTGWTYKDVRGIWLQI
ncbi:MAG: hypothetical protein NT162_03200 [Candidatus Woesebacteria bacterium]|nr:hypothetical protein [Candidatus Woesebacteria bacterium]